MKEPLTKRLKDMLPGVRIEAGESFAWSPSQQLITYKEDSLDSPDGTWALLHEVAHAKKNHTSYKSDLELLGLEVEAWNYARELGRELTIEIKEDHIQDCLDTYRDWLHRRSTCPNCGVVCLQISPTKYHCHNCHTGWTVSSSRFCRPYRLTVKVAKIKRSPSEKATFS